MTDESIFAAALAIPSPSERAAYLDRTCAGRPDLRREVEALLAAHADDNPLDRPPADLGRTGAYEPPTERPGASVGPYKLLQEIGEGGMGTVFMAEQTEPVRRKVALKIIKPGMDSKQVVARFEAERQALSLMDHPNIAKVLDAGATESGRPFFVMELVHGVPLTEFCDANKLTPRQRLELFVPVCQAIQHAHQKGIIHRDIKPGNILVTMYDDKPVPKVIDFGVAKAVEQRLTERTLFTQFGALVGTFEYMSPEQAEMNAFGVDTRSDVYALGVLLYELLTGTTPLERQRLRQAALGEVVRLIKEEEPPRPSLRLSTSGTLAKVAAARRTDPARLSALVRGELDWIVMRCLEKDRTRRYDTASALAADVTRHLKDEAVEACPPSAAYRLRKAFRKHRAAVSIAAGFAAVLLLGIGLTAWQAVRATRAEAEAARQRDEAVTSKDEAVAAHEVAATERDNVARANEALRRLTDEQRRTLYADSMTLAQAAWEGGNPARTLELLRQWVPQPGEDDPRGFEWHYWHRLAHQDLRTVRLAGFTGVDGNLSPPVLSPDGTRAAAFVSDRDGQAARLKLWDADTGREVWGAAAAGGESPPGYAGFSADGRRFTAARFTAARGEGAPRRRSEVGVWDAQTGQAVYSTRAPEGAVTGRPALSPDGSRLAVLRSVLKGAPTYGLVSVVRLSDGKEVFRFPPEGARDFVWLAAFSPDGARLAALVMGPAVKVTLRVWELDGGREVWRAPVPDGVGPMDLRFSPDGARVAARVGDEQTDEVLLWAVGSADGPRAFRLPNPPGWRLSQPPIAFAPDGRRLSVPQGTQVYLFDLDGKQPVEPCPVRGHERAVRAAAFAPGRGRLVTLDAGGSVKQWDPSGRRPRLHTPFGSLVTRGTVYPNADGSRVSHVPSPAAADRTFHLTDGSGRVVAESAVPPAPSHPDHDAFSADGRTYALLWHDGYNYTLIVWDAAAGKEIRRLTPPPNSRGSVALSPDGSHVAVATTSAPNEGGWSSSTLNVWETATGREVFSRDGIRSEDVFHAEYSPDGLRLTINPGLAADGDVRAVWLDARTGAEVATLRLGSRVLTGGALSRDGRRLALAHRAGETTVVEAWDVPAVLRGEAPEPVVLLTAAGGSFLGIDFSPDGRRVLTWGAGGVKLWDVASGREVLALRADGMTLGAARFSPDGHTIWGGLDADGRLWGWDGTPLPEGKAP